MKFLMSFGSKTTRNPGVTMPSSLRKSIAACSVVSDTEAEAYGGGFLSSVFILVGGVHQWFSGQEVLQLSNGHESV